MPFFLQPQKTNAANEPDSHFLVSSFLQQQQEIPFILMKIHGSKPFKLLALWTAALVPIIENALDHNSGGRLGSSTVPRQRKSIKAIWDEHNFISGQRSYQIHRQSFWSSTKFSTTASKHQGSALGAIPMDSS